MCREQGDAHMRVEFVSCRCIPGECVKYCFVANRRFCYTSRRAENAAEAKYGHLERRLPNV